MDIKIIKILLFFITSCLMVSFSVNHQITFKVLASIGALIYFFFIMFHLLLCFPTIMIFIISDDYFERLRLKEKSYILHKTATTIFGLLLCYVVYFVIPLILAMMWNVSFEYQKATDILQMIFFSKHS
jgi:hypothetical protein